VWIVIIGVVSIVVGSVGLVGQFLFVIGRLIGCHVIRVLGTVVAVPLRGDEWRGIDDAVVVDIVHTGNCSVGEWLLKVDGGTWVGNSSRSYSSR